MDLKKQLVSLELAKQLKDLGFKQKSIWYYAIHQDGMNEDWILLEKSECFKKDNNFYDDYSPAFTVAELGEIFQKLEIDDPLPWYTDTKWWWYKDKNPMSVKTEANARAELIIYLKENNLI